MAEQELKIKVSADIKDLVSQLDRGGISLAQFAKEANATTSKINQAGGAVNKTTRDFTGLNRVLQDLPYGFNGISNNLTQLLPAAGAAGLAFTAIVTTLTFLTTGFGAWTRGMGGASAAAKELKNTSDSLNAAISSDEYKKATTLVIELRENIRLAKDGFVDKDKVVRQYNETIGKTTGQISTLEQAEKALAKNAEAYVQMTLYKAAANATAEEAAKKLVEAEKIRLKDEKEFKNVVRDTRIASPGGAFNPAEYDRETRRIELARFNAKGKAIAAETKAADELLKIQQGFMQKAADIAKQYKFDLLGGEYNPKVKKEKIEKATISLADQIKEIFRKVDKNKDPIEFPVEVAPVVKLFDAANDPYIRNELNRDALIKKISEFAGMKNLKIPLNLEMQTTTELGETLTNAEGKFANLISLGQQLQGVFVSVFDDIASGGSNALKIFGNFIKQIITKLAAAAAVAALLTIISGGSFAGAKANSFSSFFNKLPKFASGVNNFSGGVAMVGERGPELVNLPKGSDVIPNHKLGNISGGGSGTMEITGRLVAEGDALVAVIDRANRRRGGSYG